MVSIYIGHRCPSVALYANGETTRQIVARDGSQARTALEPSARYTLSVWRAACEVHPACRVVARKAGCVCLGKEVVLKRAGRIGILDGQQGLVCSGHARPRGLDRRPCAPTARRGLDSRQGGELCVRFASTRARTRTLPDEMMQQI